MSLQKPVYFNYLEGVDAEFSPTADSIALGSITLNGLAGIAINASGNLIQNVAMPVQPGDATPKSYVDGVAAGLSYKAPVIAASGTNVASLSGTTTLDSIQVNVGDRVLLMNQTTATQNGVWVVQSGAWTRPTDFATGTHQASSAVFVEKGATYADNGFTLIADSPSDVVDTNSLTFVQYTGLGEVIVSSGLTKSGNTISVLLAAQSGLQFTNGALDHFLNPAGSLIKDANGLRVAPSYLGTLQQTLTSDANGLSVLGVPSKFTVAGAATNASVTSTTLNLVTGGTTSLADAAHNHQNVVSAQACVDYHMCGTALTAGDPVAWSATSNQLVRGDASSSSTSRIIGIALTSAAANTSVAIVKRGVAAGVLSGATPGAPIFLNTGGGLVSVMPSGQSVNMVRLGWATSASGLDVQPFFLGLRSS